MLPAVTNANPKLALKKSTCGNFINTKAAEID